MWAACRGNNCRVEDKQPCEGVCVCACSLGVCAKINIHMQSVDLCQRATNAAMLLVDMQLGTYFSKRYSDIPLILLYCFENSAGNFTAE